MVIDFIFIVLFVLGLIMFLYGWHQRNNNAFKVQSRVNEYFKSFDEQYPKEIAEELNLLTTSIPSFNRLLKKDAFKKLSEHELEQIASDLDSIKSISDKSDVDDKFLSYCVNIGFCSAGISAFWLFFSYLGSA